MQKQQTFLPQVVTFSPAGKKMGNTIVVTHPLFMTGTTK